MERDHLWKKKVAAHEFSHKIFSWSLDDILNENLYQHQVENIPLTFQSEEHYVGSFGCPLLEETRAELASSMEIMYRAPYAEIFSLNAIKSDGIMMYDVTFGHWRNRDGERGKEQYRTLPGDLLILADGKPESVSDLQHVGRAWAFSLVEDISEEYNEEGIDITSIIFKVKASQRLEFQDGMVAVFLMNITTHKRIWNSLHMHQNKNIIKEILYSDSMVKECCNICSVDSHFSKNFDAYHLDKLNDSQAGAIMAALSKTECCHRSFVEQIWGPPGTGKTKTVSVLLFILLQMKRRTLTCAPTNVAIVQVASRVLNLVKESFNITTSSGDFFNCVGEVILFGNKERLKVGTEIEEIYLENRVKRLTECLDESLTGNWKHCMRSMIDLLEKCVSQYHDFVENELLKEEQLAAKIQNETKATQLEIKSFIAFVRDQFSLCVSPLRRCILTFLTHIPKSFTGEHNFQKMVSLLDDLRVFKSLLFKENLVSEELEKLFTFKPLQNEFDKLRDMTSINFIRVKCLSILRTLRTALEGLGLPSVSKRFAIKDFCFQNASLIFCTTSTSYKLHTVEMKPLEILVIDEAAQLKEAESIIPLQLPGIKHAILIGDECQLPAMVSSNVCIESGFGRSLFGRLSSLGHSKHLLAVQYRMHPSVSLFPNRKFYQNRILDAENVTCKSYEKRYLSGPMFGSYSFINVAGGREDLDDDKRSRRNMLEVAIVIKIVHNLYKAWKNSRRKLTIGVISPYVAQVVSIQEKLAHKYEKLDGFSVTVKSIDGFQGGEEDIIILSTVRSNSHGSVGFLSSPERTNVALTRARHCLWILGNERTLTNSEYVWRELVCDAKKRHCLFDADADESLKTTIIAAKKELDQLEDLVNGNSVLFKNEKWKVLFSDDFRRSFGKLTSPRLKKLVLNLLLKLSGGWRPKNRSVDVCCEKSSQILSKFKVDGLYIICSVDIIKEVKYIQVLKVWDILTLDEIPKLIKRLESIFSAYTDDYINRCIAKCVEGNLEAPRTWPASQEIVRFQYLSNSEGESEVSVNHGEGRNYVENSKVSESLLLMKFYSLSRGVVSHLLSGKELDLPMQVTDEQMDIVLFCKSSFIIGRSGTGKTTILTMKLFKNEQNFRVASEGINEEESSQTRDVGIVDDFNCSKPSVLRQLFVTVSSKLCYAVKQHVSQLTSISCHGKSSAEINLEDADITSEFSDIPDSFVEVPVKDYPLVITFHKFLMMLDGTLGSSYFERFLEAREGSQSNNISSGTVALQSFIRNKEVTFDRFCSLYWPHFNSNHKKRLDPSRVFTEIISHIKGGLQAGEFNDGKLSLEDYSLLAKIRSSTLTKQKRENVYSLFQAYENMKTERGEFDLGDLVNDLHHRLKNANYEGDQMDFIYIDEVQDLSMRQISLFKYICQNVDEGFIFAGDTAQTIARGIDFRFQDIRTLFNKEFLTSTTAGKQEKGLISEIFQLKQNFRTHAGVLDLAQSVIDILYCYFSHSVDILEPETSLISGEAPVVLESGNDENSIVTIFGGSGSRTELVSFGAEQVIMVRDDIAKTEICECIGKQALVLTIVECKGLEFQDVLLYNFFGTSPLKDQWRVIYEYMKEHDWLDENLPQSFPNFSESRHSVLCSELKHLYVAITRTRQRLWICENKEELSKPMVDYWKRRGLVQIRKLDDSVAHAMRVASSPQEWRERGKKLFCEGNFVMATMCFERAGDKMWETLAKASGLRASGDQIRVTNPEAFSSYVREAAEMFESIGKLESAASCYCDLREYERAGKIYLYKCGKMDAAAKCFTLAGCYSDAAEAYAKGNKLSNCLSVCEKGKLFDKGLQYIEQWKEHFNVQSKEMEQIQQEFLEICARDYYEHKDTNSMMKFVRAFCSMESKRVFLKSLGCLDHLLLLEKESGHFLDAAELARSWGDVLKEADLLEKAGHFKDAAILLLWYVFFSSLWGSENKGWPPNQFAQKEELCEKAKTFAKINSEMFFDFVCSELKVVSEQHCSLAELKKDLHVSQRNKSLRGNFCLIRKILDSHIHLNSSNYDWEDKLPIDINKHCEDMTLRNQASVRTLVFYWNSWKENVLDIFERLESFHKDEPNEHEGRVDFILNYFGVRKQRVKGKIVYMLGNERTLINSEYVWKELVCDARNRHCLFDADVNENRCLFKHAKSKGSECDYRHSDSARVDPRDCWYCLNGNCLNPKCGFRHPVKQLPRVPPRIGGAGDGIIMEPPRYKPAYVVPAPVMNGLLPRRFNHGVNETNHVSDNEGITGKDVDKYSREPTPGFDVLVDSELGDSKYCHNEEQFGRSRGHDFDMIRSVDYDHVDHGMHHDERDFDHYNKEGYAWEDQRENSNSGRKYPRDESPDQFDQSDLRHHLSKRRRGNYGGGLRSVTSREHSCDNHTVLVDNELGESEYYHYEEQFGRSRGHDFDMSRSVDHDVDHHMYHDECDFDHYNKSGYAWEDQSITSCEHSCDNHTVLVDNELGESEYYHNEEQFGRSSGHDFDMSRSVDYDVDHDMHHDERDFDHYNKEGYAWEDQKENSKFGKKYPSDESPDQFDQSDLRHRISKKRRGNNGGGLRSVISREDACDNHTDMMPRRDIHYDRHNDHHLDSGTLSRLQGRIKISVWSTSPGYEHGSRVKRENDMGRQQQSRYSPGRAPHVSSSHSRFRDYRSYRGNYRAFTVPKRLSRIKSQQTDGGQTLGRRKYPRTESQQSKDKFSFEGPKPLSEILKRKRGSAITFVNNEDNNSNKNN